MKCYEDKENTDEEDVIKSCEESKMGFYLLIEMDRW